jgi:hypothetical protein
MKLYIETENGKVKNHPAFEDNLIAAFGAVPEHWVSFERVEKPLLNVYEVWISQDPTYELVEGVYKDIWHKRNMTTEEVSEKQQKIKDTWASNPDVEYFSAWTFDEATCEFVPPVPQPDDGKQYFWQGITASWVELPQRPNDGKKYKLDNASATWVEIT